VKRVFFTDRDLGKRFPAILQEAGILVERHCDHFPDDAPDELWLPVVGAKRWVVLTHDQRIRYKPNERLAVMSNGVAMFVVIGKAPYPELARGVVATMSRIEAFLERTEPPFIAKIYRAGAAELARDPNAPGRVEHWV
jgi:hypothetical protein